MGPDERSSETSGVTSTASLRARALIAGAAPDPDLVGVAADLQRVCRAAVSGLPVAGAVVHLVPGQDSGGVAAASDGHWRQVGESAHALGESPCADAARTLRPVLVPDLVRAARRWPVYCDTVSGDRVAAVFSLPLQVGAVCFGVLDLYAERVGSLSPGDLALALTLARVATATVLAGVGSAERPGQTGHGLSQSGMLPGLEESLDRAEVYQAQGMVMVLLGTSLADALVLLRSVAYSLDRPLLELARDVVAGAVDPRTW